MSTENEGLPTPRAVNESEFNANCQEIMDDATARDALELAFGRYQGQFRIYGDIVAPMPAEWFAVPDDDIWEQF